jgi:hypothetical protein
MFPGPLPDKRAATEIEAQGRAMALMGVAFLACAIYDGPHWMPAGFAAFTR